MDEEEVETTRKSRMKELEAMVLQLEQENKQLLNKVTESAEKYGEEASSGRKMAGKEGAPLMHAQSVDDLISLDGEMARANEDEWLYTSPAKPPTPNQKQVTPSQWLTRLEAGGGAPAEDSAFSLDDVRKDLSFQIMNAEGLSPITRRKAGGGGGGGGSTASPLTAHRQLSNPTAQKYLDQVRERRESPPPPNATPLTPPMRRRQARMPPDQSHITAGSEDDVPVVKWKRPVIPQDDPISSEEAVPVVRWKKPVLPQDESPSLTTEEAVPVVRWKKPVIPQDEPQTTATEEAVPVVRWKKPVIPQDEPQTTATEEAVPVMRWKKPVMPQNQPQSQGQEDAVPVVRWKARVPEHLTPSEGSGSEEGEVSRDSSTGPEGVPVVNWKPPRHKNVPVKAIVRTAKSPPGGEEAAEEEEEEEYRGRKANTLPRSGMRSPRGSVGLRPPGQGSMPAPSSRARTSSAERRAPRQAGSSPLRSRSPSPSGLRQPVRIRSRSPSPHSPSSSPLLSKMSPRSTRKHPPPHTSPSPTSNNLQQPQTHQMLVKSLSASGPRKLAPPSGAGGPLGTRRLPQSSSTPSTASPGQRRFVSPSQASPGRQLGPGTSSLTPPSSSSRPQRQQQPNGTSSPSSAPQRAGGAARSLNFPQATAREGSPRSAPGSQIKPARNSAAPPSRQNRQSKPHPQKQAQPEVDWLEGCF